MQTVRSQFLEHNKAFLRSKLKESLEEITELENGSNDQLHAAEKQVLEVWSETKRKVIAEVCIV